MLRPVTAAFLTAIALPAMANDSVGEIGAGGIVLGRSNEIELKREDLYISPELVTVDYVFHNHAERDIETLVAFPMPAISTFPDSDISVPERTSDNFLGFSVMHDGKAIVPALEQRVEAAGVDVTAELVAAGVPLRPWDEAADVALKTLPDDLAADWQARGIIGIEQWDAGEGWQTYRFPRWELHSTYHWRATFPAGKDIKVAHRYKPAVGATAGLNFYWDGNPSDYWDSYAQKYCVDRDFAKALDRAARPNSGLFESRIDYILTSGGNWANGTIGTFHLTVDKGKPENLVSFCGEGVKKTGATRFEMTAENYYPERDVHVLLVQRFSYDGEPVRNLKAQPPITVKKDGG